LLTADGLVPEDEQRREAKRRLVAETRRLVEAVALVDGAATSDAEVEALTARVAAVTAEIESAPSLREQGLFSSKGFSSHLAERSPISGQSNPLAAPLEMWLDGDVTRARATYGPAYEGPPGCLHGGVVAGAFDELLGVAQMASGSAGFTGTLIVRMRRPTPLGRTIEYEGGVDRVDGRKIHAWGRSTCDGELLAEAEGIFISGANGRPPYA
jgi:acyl-coenzyme A thioesterase PaaI-like protein